MIRRWSTLGICFFFLFFVPITEAANRYVRAGATGAADGTDWNNAYATLPATLTRGDTYYVADGSYGAYTFDDAVSGTTVITIQRATVANHGTDVGWSNTYADGQTAFGQLTFMRSFYVIDGMTRNENDWQDVASYGLRVSNVRASTGDGSSASQITIRYSDIGGTPGSICGASDPGSAFYIVGGLNNWTIARSHIHNVDIPLLTVGSNNLLIEYNHIGPSWAKEAISNQNGAGWIIRYNRFMDNLIFPPVACQHGGDGGTADIWTRSTSGANDGWEIYGNVFGDTGTYTNMVRTNAAVLGNFYSGPGDIVSNWKVYNNVFYNIQGSFNTIKLGSGSNNTVANNLWYKSRTSTQSLGITNAGSGATNVTSWCNSTPFSLCPSSPGTWVLGGEDPFVNATTMNFRLKASFSGPSPVNAGTSLGVGFNNIDPDGNVRGAGGAWDIGVYEQAGIATLAITTIFMPGGVTGANYSQQISAVNGTTPYSWVLLSGSLPAGLSLSSGGLVSGAPTTAGTSSFTVEVTDSAVPVSTDTQLLDIVITTVTIQTTSPLPNGSVNQAYNETLTATNGTSPYTWNVSAGALPAGLSLSSAGVISGTPTTDGQSTLTIRAVDANSEAATKIFTVTILATSQNLVNTGLVVRYFLNEASSGTAPTQALDASNIAYHLSLDYGTSGMAYTTVGTNSGLDSTALTGTQRASRSLVSIGDEVRAKLNGQQRVTLEVVLRLDIRGTTHQSRVFGLIDEILNDVGRCMLKAAQGSDNYVLSWNNVNVKQWVLDVGTREVWHIVVDTTQTTEANRVSVYKNGVSYVSTTTAALPLNSTLVLDDQHTLIALNRPTPFGTSLNGVLFYAAIYAAAFTATNVADNYAILTVDDDAPSSPPGSRPSVGARPPVTSRPPVIDRPWL